MKPTNFRLLFITFLILFLTGLSSCSDKNDTPDVPDIPEKPDKPNDPDQATESEHYESYDIATTDLINLIQNDDISTNSELVETAKTYDNFVSAKEIEGIQYLYFKGNLEFFVDFSEECRISSNGDIETDDSELNNLVEELDNFYNTSTNSLSSYTSFSRATDHVNYCASSKKVLLWCPLDLESESSSIKNQINTAIKALKKPTYNTKIPWNVTIKLGDECSTSDFKTFDQYDIVFFIAHGSIKGEPMVPKSFNVKGSKGIIGKDSYNILTSKFLSDNLPSMPNTVIWTLMCHSIRENAVFASEAKAKSVGDFFGASNSVDVSTSIRYFKPFYLRLGLGMNSYEAFSPEGENNYGYSINTTHGNKKGVFGHDNVNGVCFPLQHVCAAENNKPVGVWQTSIGVMDKVKNGNGSFNAGIKLENADTGESTLKEVSNDNIDSSESKKFENFFEEIKYSFKTDGLESGTYNYRSYITYPDGTTQYSENSETFTIMDQDTKYFELYFDIDEVSRIGSMEYTGNINILGVLCDNNSIDYIYGNYGSDYNLNYLNLYFDDSPVGIHRCRIFYEGDIESIKSIKPEYYYYASSLCGGYFPYSIEDIYIEYHKIKHISSDSTNRGDFTLTVPNSIKNIDMRECQFLTTVDLSNCSNLTTIQSTDTDWTSRGFHANFYNCNSLSSIDLSNCTNLTTIESHAFYKCSSLSSIDLSNCTNLTTIEWDAFYECSSLSSIDLSNCTNLTTIESHAFYKCSSLSSIDLSDCSSLTTIEYCAFYECSSLSSIDLSSNLTTIVQRAFCGCTALSSIDLSKCSNLTEIGSLAFSDCNLSQITIPASVKEIGYGSFDDNPLKTAYCYPNNPPGYSNPFDEECKIYVPAQSLEAYQKAWGKWEYINGIRTCVNIFPM